MSKLEKARQRLREVYRKTFPSKIETLRNLSQRLIDADPTVDTAIRRVAHQLHGSGASYGFEAISYLAAEVEHSKPSEMRSTLENLIQTLQRLGNPNQETSSYPELRLLVVEDDMDQIIQLQDAFALHYPHWSVISAQSVQEAEVQLVYQTIDAIILDLVLSQEDGRDFLERLRQDPSTETVPIAVLTMLEGIDTEQECIGLGADLFFKKPPHLELLAFSITGIVERRLALLREGSTDPLTSLLNRKGVTQEFERQSYLANRAGFALSLAFIDVDRFKAINDAYGHAQGDRVLTYLAALLRTELRRVDVAARWGGEEFVVLMPDTKPSGAHTALCKVKYALSQAQLINTDDQQQAISQPVTFSGGVTRVRSDDTLEDAVARADHLMYEAKKAGRNLIFQEGTEHAARHFKILAVEDDLDMARYIRHVLEAADFDVTLRRDGKSALELAKRQTFDLIILDGMLPQLTGFSVLKHLRELPTYDQVPIVMLTVLRDMDNLEIAFRRGADDYLTKPFRERELIARIHRLLKHPSHR